MRMWMVPPWMLCDQHLLGEHYELHMFVGTILKGKSINGFVTSRLVETASIQARHDSLVAEMERRGMVHASPMKYKDKLGLGKVDVKQSLRSLRKRCEDCRTLQMGV